jgi:glycerophosphoryl diester phosphodiesterase
MRSPRILGHRGAPFAAPENTLAAFRAALRAGADGVELDVRLCRTGELVVCHDATLARLAGIRVRVAASSAMALRRCDLGHGRRMPLLREVLEEFAGSRVNVEVKADDGAPEALAQALAAELKRRGRRGPSVIVSSFAPAVLAALRARAPSVPRGLLLTSDPIERGRALASLRAVKPHALHPPFALCTPERVGSWRRQGFAVNAWTVDAPDDVLAMARAGVDTIITNQPAVALAALRAHGFR